LAGGERATSVPHRKPALKRYGLGTIIFFHKSAEKQVAVSGMTSRQ